MEILDGLTQIGFTAYEAKVYLALLHENPATGYQLSKKSGVPRSMVYDALGRLSARGAVMESIEGRATLYRPLPPELLLDNYQEEQRQMTEELREAIASISSTMDEDRVWSITGRNSIWSYAAQMIQSAHQEIFLVLRDEDLEILSPEIAAANSRNVNLNTLLTGHASLDLGQVAHHPLMESEMQELTHTLLVVVDKAKVLIADTKQEATATITRSRNLVLIARQFVWMELFAQRIAVLLGSETISKLDPEDQKIFASSNHN